MSTTREEIREAIQTGRSDRIAEAVDRWMVGTLNDTELADVMSISLPTVQSETVPTTDAVTNYRDRGVLNGR